METCLIYIIVIYISLFSIIPWLSQILQTIFLLQISLSETYMDMNGQLPSVPFSWFADISPKMCDSFELQFHKMLTDLIYPKVPFTSSV